MAKYEKWIQPNGLVLLEGWARDGLTNEQIAANIGISPKTLYEWLKKFPEIKEKIESGKEVVDRLVENALLKRALGYEYTEKTYETSKEGKKTRVTKKQVAPDTTAAIFWLKNRKVNEWRDKRVVDVDSEVMEKLDDIMNGVDRVMSDD